jgi:hypothetical protein
VSGNVIPFPAVRKGEKPDLAPSLEGFRWWAVVDYPSGESKPIVFDEFDELGEFMEKGPDWSGCTIRIAHYEKALEAHPLPGDKQ